MGQRHWPGLTLNSTNGVTHKGPFKEAGQGLPLTLACYLTSDWWAELKVNPRVGRVVPYLDSDWAKLRVSPGQCC